MAQKPKNPLNVMFGAFIQDERRQQFANLSVTELAKDKLKMSVSLYKMTEAGLASFSLNRVINFLETFKDSELIFDRVLKFIAGQNIVDNLIIKQKTPQQASEDLAKIDEEFRALYINTEKYFEYEDGSPEHKEFIQNKAIEEVRRFLQTPSYAVHKSDILEKTSFDKELLKKLKIIPSLSMGLFFEFIESYSHFIPLHFGDIAAKWEDDNSSTFESLDGLFDVPEMIIDKKNLEKFHHSYIAEEQFKAVRYVFCKKSKFKDKQEIVDEYKRILNECRKEKGLPMISKNVFDSKVSVEILNPEDLDMIKSLLRLPHSPATLSKAFWFFHLKPGGSRVGFTGVVQNDVNIVYNLSYGDLNERVVDFNILWKTLQSRNRS